MADSDYLDYRLRCHTKRTDLPADVLRDIGEAYAEIVKSQREIERLRKERDNMAPDAMHPKHVCDFIYCPEIATCMVCENWTDALVMCYPDDFQDEEETK